MLNVKDYDIDSQILKMMPIKRRVTLKRKSEFLTKDMLSTDQLENKNNEFDKINDFRGLIDLLSIPPEKRDNDKISKIINYFDDENVLELFKKAKGKEIEPKLINDCFARHMQIQNLVKDEVLFRLNDFGDRFYLILSGRIGIFIPDKKKKTMTQLEYFKSLEKNLFDNELSLLKLTLSQNYEKINFHSYEDFIDYLRLKYKLQFHTFLSKMKNEIQYLTNFYKENKKIFETFFETEKFEDINFISGKTLDIIEEEYENYKKENILCEESNKNQMMRRRRTIFEMEQLKREKDEQEAYEKKKFIRENKERIIESQKKIVLVKFELDEKEINLKNKYFFMEDNEIKLDFTVFEYLGLEPITNKQYFGDLALDSAKCVRKATCKAVENCTLGYLTRDIYREYIFFQKQERLSTENTFLHSLTFFNNITSSYFRNKYFKFFAIDYFNKGETLTNPNTPCDKIYILNTGILDITMNVSIKDINEVIKIILKKLILLNFIDETEFKNYSSQYLINFSLKDLTDEQVKKVTEKKTISISSLKTGEVIGLETLLLGINSVSKCSVYSDTAKVFSIENNNFHYILNKIKDCKKKYMNLAFNKIKSLLNRLNTIRNSCFNMIAGKTGIVPIQSLENNLYSLQVLKEYKTTNKDGEKIDLRLDSPKPIEVKKPTNIISSKDLKNMKEIKFDNETDYNENRFARIKRKSKHRHLKESLKEEENKKNKREIIKEDFEEIEFNLNNSKNIENEEQTEKEQENNFKNSTLAALMKIHNAKIEKKSTKIKKKVKEKLSIVEMFNKDISEKQKSNKKNSSLHDINESANEESHNSNSEKNSRKNSNSRSNSYSQNNSFSRSNSNSNTNSNSKSKSSNNNKSNSRKNNRSNSRTDSCNNSKNESLNKEKNSSNKKLKIIGEKVENNSKDKQDLKLHLERKSKLKNINYDNFTSLPGGNKEEIDKSRNIKEILNKNSFSNKSDNSQVENVITPRNNKSNINFNFSKNSSSNLKSSLLTDNNSEKTNNNQEESFKTKKSSISPNKNHNITPSDFLNDNNEKGKINENFSNLKNDIGSKAELEKVQRNGSAILIKKKSKNNIESKSKKKKMNATSYEEWKKNFGQHTTKMEENDKIYGKYFAEEKEKKNNLAFGKIENKVLINNNKFKNYFNNDNKNKSEFENLRKTINNFKNKNVGVKSTLKSAKNLSKSKLNEDKFLLKKNRNNPKSAYKSNISLKLPIIGEKNSKKENYFFNLDENGNNYKLCSLEKNKNIFKEENDSKNRTNYMSNFNNKNEKFFKI